MPYFQVDKDAQDVKQIGGQYEQEEWMMKILICKKCNMDIMATMTNKCSLCGNKLVKEEVPDDYYDDF